MGGGGGEVQFSVAQVSRLRKARAPAALHSFLMLPGKSYGDVCARSTRARKCPQRGTFLVRTVCFSRGDFRGENHSKRSDTIHSDADSLQFLAPMLATLAKPWLELMKSLSDR